MPVKKFVRLLFVLKRIHAPNKKFTMMTNRIFTSSILISFCLTFFGPAARAQVCAPAPSGLVAWYKGENGNTLDSSGSGNHGSGGAPTTSGHVGDAFNLTSQDQSIPLINNPSMFPLTTLSIEGWVNPLDYAGCSVAYRIFHTVQFEPLRGYAAFINCPTQKMIGALFDPTGVIEAVASNTSIPVNTFTHFAVTWDGSNLRMYINGVLDNTVPTTIAMIGTNSDFVRIGNSISHGFRGRIDETSLYNRALSGSEIAAIFNAGTAGKCVTISGRVVTTTGRGISGIPVILSDKNGVLRTAMTSSFGYYRLFEVPVGQTYTVTPTAKHYTFDPRMITVSDEMTGVDFIGSP